MQLSLFTFPCPAPPRRYQAFLICDVATVADLYPHHTAGQIAAHMGHQSIDGVRGLIRRFGLRKHRYPPLRKK